MNSSGVPTALSSGGVTVYQDGSTVQNTTGVTLTASFNAVTGYNRVQIDMVGTSTFYLPGSEFVAIISSGAASESLAGYTLAHWSVIRGTPVIVSTAVSISTASLISTSNVFASVATVTGNVTGSVGSVASATGLATAIWGATRSSYVAAGSFGEIVSTSTSAPDQWVAASVSTAVTISTATAIDSVTSVNSTVSADVRLWLGTAPSTLGTGGAIRASSTLEFLALSTAGIIADAVWDEGSSEHVSTGTFGQNLFGVRAGTAGVANGSSWIVLDSGASTRDDFYNSAMVLITGGGAIGQTRIIEDYDGSSRAAFVSPAWIVNPASTSQFVVLPFDIVLPSSSVSVAEWLGVAPSTLGPNSNLQVSTATLISTAQTIASVASITSTVAADVRLWLGIAPSTLGPNANLQISTAANIASASSVTTVGSLIAISTTAAAQINAEVVDALATDTYGEPTAGPPPATPTLSEMLRFQHFTLRHQIRVNSSNKTFFNSSGQTLWTKSLLGDSATYIELLGTTAT